MYNTCFDLDKQYSQSHSPLPVPVCAFLDLSNAPSLPYPDRVSPVTRGGDWHLRGFYRLSLGMERGGAPVAREAGGGGGGGTGGEEGKGWPGGFHWDWWIVKAEGRRGGKGRGSWGPPSISKKK